MKSFLLSIVLFAVATLCFFMGRDSLNSRDNTIYIIAMIAYGVLASYIIIGTFKKESKGFEPMVGDADDDHTLRSLRKKGIKKGVVSNSMAERIVFYLDKEKDNTPMARQVKSIWEEKLLLILIFFK